MGTKVLVIGLDGATFDLILPLVAEGKLPSLSKLIQGGVSGTLTSTYPPLTGPAWSSFMTGKTPAQHGVLEFFRRQEGSYHQVLNNRLDIDGKSLWSFLSEGGKQVGVVGVPLTYPPEPVNGFLITGLLTPPNRRDFTYPPGLLEELEAHLGQYHLRHDEKYRPGNPFPILKEEYQTLENNTQAALYLIKQKEWDFLMLHFYGTDRIQHEFWHLIDPEHPRHEKDEADRLGDVVRDFYQRIDESIGKLLAAVDEDTLVMIMSDHGFGPIYKFINFNVWLLKHGYLRLKKNPGTFMRYLSFRLGFNYSRIGNWILNLGLGKQTVRLGRANREKWQRRVFLSLNDIDWSKSRVYSIGNFGQLFVNLKGREPLGIVSPGKEYEEVIQDLTQRLNNLIDPESGQPVIEKIMLKDEVYPGKYYSQAPDLTFFTREMKYKAMGLSDFASNKVFETVFGTTGHHRMNGILICNRPGIIKQNAVIDNAHIYDLAPTILYLMGLQIPVSMDGNILTELFTNEYLEKHKILYRDSDLPSVTKDLKKLSEQEETILMDMLRSLGYVN